MQVFAAMAPQLPLAAVPGYARRIERLGFDGLHIAETIHDSIAAALLALEHTLKRRGWTELADRLRTLAKAQRWNEMPTALTDVVLDELVTCGRYEELPEILRTKFDGIADGLVLPPIADGADDRPIQACVWSLR
ncbi:MAG: hypothetical protein ACLPXZ_12945 [Mycobacterium sp.]